MKTSLLMEKPLVGFVHQSNDFSDIFSRYTFTIETVKVRDIKVDYLAEKMCQLPDEFYIGQWKDFSALKTPVINEDNVLGYGVQDYYAALAAGEDKIQVKKVQGIDRDSFMLFVCFAHYFTEKSPYVNLLKAIRYVESRLRANIKKPWVRKLKGNNSRSKTANLLHLGSTTVQEIQYIQKHDATGLARVDKGFISFKELYRSIKARNKKKTPDRIMALKPEGKPLNKTPQLAFNESGLLFSKDPDIIISELLYQSKMVSRITGDGRSVCIKLTERDKAIAVYNDGTTVELDYAYEICWDYQLESVGSVKEFFFSKKHLQSFTFISNDFHILR